MNDSSSIINRNRRRGSAFITVIIFTFVMFALVLSIITWSLSERRINMRNASWLEARNAAEAVAELGASQINNLYYTQANPPSFDPAGSTPLSLPSASFFAGGNVVTSTYSSTNPNGLQIIGGTISSVPTSGGLYYVNPSDPDNQTDQFNGQYIYRRDISVLAKATVIPAVGSSPITAYVKETVSVRGAPLFSHAIFYANNDLEIFPGPQMDIYGPVHCNGNIFVSNQGNINGLNFHGLPSATGTSVPVNCPVSATGNIYHAWANSNSVAEGSGGETLGQNQVTFVNSAGTSINMNSTGTASGWKDSTMGASNGVSGLSSLSALVTSSVTSQFNQYASQTWNGNLQTSAMGVSAYNPIAFNEIIDSSGNTPDPHSLIDAPSTPATSDPYYTAKNEVEKQKLSTQAGLYIQVDVTSGSPVINFYGPSGSAPAGTSSSLIGPNGGIKLTVPVNLSNAPSDATNPPLVTYLPFKRLKTTVTKSGSTYTTTKTVLLSNGTVDPTVTLAPTTASSGTTGTKYTVYSDTNTGSYGYGMYDQRRGGSTNLTTTASLTSSQQTGQIDLVQLDMKALANAVTAMIPELANPTLIANNAIKNADGSVWTSWNGGVYVDVKSTNSGTSSQTTSVRLVDGTVASSSSLIPSSAPGGNAGLTVATNAPVYVLGNFNSNGSVTSTSSTTPDDGHTGAIGDSSAESPVCIAGDAITLLSPTWSDSNSLTLKPSTSTSMEVAAAFLTGITATSNSSSSGGAHNLPRFLESWSATVAIRGSLVTMYSSKIATQPWSTAYYGAPTRKWGFDSLFQNGVYPPITPKVISFKRVSFTILNAASYATQAHALWPSSY